MKYELKKKSEIFFAAADYIAEHGHCQWILEDSAGRVCLMGAILKAQVEDVELYFVFSVLLWETYAAQRQELLDDLMVAIYAIDSDPQFETFALPGRSSLFGDPDLDQLPSATKVIRWNNYEERSAEEVILALKHAGHRAQADEDESKENVCA